MNCIGDECARPGKTQSGSTIKPFSLRSLRSFAIGGVCAGMGYQLAISHHVEDPAHHVRVLAPPIVLVSAIGSQ